MMQVMFERTIKIIDNSFCPMCENAHIHLVSRFLQVTSKYLPALAEFSGVEWGCQGLYDKSNDKLYASAQLLPHSIYEQKYKRKDKKYMRNV